jgi:nitrogen fixation/metabolism regulation signal transduction histidine kinase
VPTADREKPFMPAIRRAAAGGLAIVRRIVAEHGGRIDVGDACRRDGVHRGAAGGMKEACSP